MRANKFVFGLMAMLAMLVGMQQPLMAAKRHKDSSSSSSHHHKKKTCCKEVLDILEQINLTTQHDLTVDLQDLVVDQKTLNIVSIIENIVGEIRDLEGTAIYQSTIDDAGGTLTLTESGKYCLAENVVGTIVLDTDCICLNLCCHTLDADGAPFAISSTAHEGVVISNGCVINSTSAAVLLTSCAAVEVADLHMHDNALDAIRATDSKGLNIHGINSVGTVSGERILKLDTCANILFSQSAATGYTSRIGAIVELNSCNAASLQDIDVTGNIKNLLAANGNFSISAAFVNADLCTGIDLVRVKVNNNTFNTPSAFDKRYSGIGFTNSKSCSMVRCETSSNIYAGAVGSELVVDRMLFIGQCDSITVTDHQANENSCPGQTIAFRPYNNRASNNTVFDGCQANNNFVQTLSVSAVFSADLYGFFAQGAQDTVFRNCQANFNRVVDGGAGRVISFIGTLFGIHIQGSGVIDHCQTNHNSMGTTAAFQFVNGIALSTAANDVLVSNCSADSNTGGIESVGIAVVSNKRSLISNCSASANGRYGISIGVPTLALIASDVTILDCVCHGNGGVIGDSAGILVAANGANVLIKGCQIYETVSTNPTGASAGIKAVNAANIVVEDSEVFSTTAVGAGHGILFDTVTDSKIIRTQLHRNKSAGVELIGTNTTVAIVECVAMSNDKGYEFASGSTASCCLVQDNRALKNTTAGFVYAALPTPFTVTFIGNEAQCNGAVASTDNYALGGNNIPLQSLSWTTGVSAQVGATTAVLGSRIANTYMIP